MRSFVLPEGNNRARVLSKKGSVFSIDSDVNGTIIKLLLEPAADVEEISTVDGDTSPLERAKENALRQFIYQEEDDCFQIRMSSMLKMNMLVDFVSVGLSFTTRSN